ncbi:hypothetical protein HZC30_06250 [Candidatus Woesearchaeota archaeon]|nr:hypothetical protein [Candidatus Woesearchaeota archaeon]
MAEKQYTLKEQQKIKKYHDLFNAKNELHNLLRRVVVSTKLGTQEKQPDDDIELDIGNGSLGSCGKYEQVRYFPTGLFTEHQLDDDLEMINYLITEIKQRFQAFRKARDSNPLDHIKGKKKFAKQFFDLPLHKIKEKYGGGK